jgi:RNA polymerase sigma-70 factor (ECF subfamily)
MTVIAETKRKESDLQLVKDVQSGIPSRVRIAQETFYKEYHPILLNQMLRNVKSTKDAEDLAIQALTKALTQVEKYKPEYAFSTWIQSIAKNLLIDFKRKSRLEVKSIEELRNRTNEDDYEFEIQDEELSALEIVIRKESHSELNHKLNLISENAHKLLILRFFEELKYEEISEQLDMPIGTIKARLHRAKEELKLAYQDV